MEIIIWIVIGLFFITSFVSLVFPVLPGLLFLWGGFFLYHFFINENELTLSFWIFQVGLTVFLFLVDFLANSYFIQEKTDSKWSERIGCVSIIVGSFIIPPIGLILVPFFAVFLAEILQKKSFIEAFQTAFATVIAFLSSVIAKAIVQVVMIVMMVGYLYF